MGPIQKVFLYLKFSIKTFVSHPGIKTMWEPLRYFRCWYKSMSPGRNSVSDKMPWISFPSLKYIREITRPEMIVFEYGSGGSTLYWSSRVQKVISIEHDREWYQLLKNEFDKQGNSKVDYRLAEAQDDSAFANKSFEDPADYISSDQSFLGKSFENYVRQIDQFPDQHFDIVVVDGRARPSCILHALPKLKVGGYIIVDNSERDYYFKNIDLKNTEWKRKDFPGPVPYTYNFYQTSVIQKTGR